MFLCDVYFVLVVVHGIFLKELDLKNKLIHVYSLLGGIANWLQRYTYCFFGLFFYVFHTCLIAHKKPCLTDNIKILHHNNFILMHPQ